jgi:hypothetical protein
LFIITDNRHTSEPILIILFWELKSGMSVLK